MFEGFLGLRYIRQSYCRGKSCDATAAAISAAVAAVVQWSWPGKDSPGQDSEEEGKLGRVLFRRSFCVGLEPSESTVVDRRDGKTRLDEDEEVKWSVVMRVMMVRAVNLTYAYDLLYEC